MRDHGGQSFLMQQNLGLSPQQVLDLSTSVSPLGLPPQMNQALQHWDEWAQHYPEADTYSANQSLAQAHGLQAEQVVCGNGSTELMGLILLVLKPCMVRIPEPSWSGYQEVCQFAEVPFRFGSWEQAQPGEAVILASPNNPDGTEYSTEYVQTFCQTHPDVWVILDLAFDDFKTSPDQSPWWQKRFNGNLIRVKSMTKFFSIPGLRLGFMAWEKDERAQRAQAQMQKRLLPWRVNHLAAYCAEHAYDDPHWMQKTRQELSQLCQMLAQIFQEYGFVVKAQIAWILVWPTNGESASVWYQKLMQHGIAVRLLDWQDGFLRVGLPCRNQLEQIQMTLHQLVDQSA